MYTEPNNAALLLNPPWINSPLISLSFNNFEEIIIIIIEKNVAKKQNNTNFPSQTSIKFETDKSLKSKIGNEILNTKLFNLFAKFSSIAPILLKINPNAISKNTGIVAFKLKIKSFTHHPLSFVNKNKLYS